MDQQCAPVAPVGEDAFEQMQRRLARFENPFLILDPKPEQIARAKATVIASMERARKMEAMKKRDKRIGAPDIRADKTERRHGDRRRGSRKDESSPSIKKGD